MQTYAVTFGHMTTRSSLRWTPDARACIAIACLDDILCSFVEMIPPAAQLDTTTNTYVAATPPHIGRSASCQSPRHDTAAAAARPNQIVSVVMRPGSVLTTAAKTTTDRVAVWLCGVMGIRGWE